MRRLAFKTAATLLLLAFAIIAIDAVSKSIKPRLDFVSTESNDTRTIAHFNLTNRSFRPIYPYTQGIVEFKANGEWKQVHEHIRCLYGFGWSRFAQFGQSERTFVVPPTREAIRDDDNRPISGQIDEMRVGVDYRYSEDGESHMVWSDPIRLDELIPGWNN